MTLYQDDIAKIQAIIEDVLQKKLFTKVSEVVEMGKKIKSEVLEEVDLKLAKIPEQEVKAPLSEVKVSLPEEASKSSKKKKE
jgi:hypothetical protein